MPPISQAFAVAAAAGTAATASLAYLSAKSQMSHDLSLLAAGVAIRAAGTRYDRAERASLFYRFEERALDPAFRDKNYLIYESKHYTFGQTYTLVLKYATWLKSKYGVQKDETVAMDFMNTPELLFLMFAVWQLGAIPVLINYNLLKDGLLHCVKTSKTKILLIDPETAAKVLEPATTDALNQADFRGEGKGGVSIIVVDDEIINEVQETEGRREPDEVRTGVGLLQGRRMAALIYTSGTTGMPKPAIVSHFKLHAAIYFDKFWAGLKPNDVFYTCMPLYHSSATLMCAIPCAALGCTLALGRRFSNSTFWPEVRASKATIIQYVGETCRYLLTAPPQIDPSTGENLDRKHNVRLAFGNGLRSDVWTRFKDRFGIEEIAEFYSATEAPGALWNFTRNDFGTGAVGRWGTLMKWMMKSRMRIVALDPATDLPIKDPKTGYCTPVPPGERGEFLIALELDDEARTFQGYYGNEGASRAKIVRGAFKKGDAWFRSGDIVRIDEQGCIFFVDRIGDSFRWRAENVSTQEVGGVMSAHPAVAEANVYGVELPHHDGRAGCAAMTMLGSSTYSEDGAEAPIEVSVETLRSLAAHATNNLPKAAIPQFLRLVPKLEATGNYKQQKHTLRGQGVDPANVGLGEKMFWLRDGTYAEFGPGDWEKLRAGRIKL